MASARCFENTAMRSHRQHPQVWAPVLLSQAVGSRGASALSSFSLQGEPRVDQRPFAEACHAFDEDGIGSLNQVARITDRWSELRARLLARRGAPPSRKSHVRELRADAVKVRRPRESGVGAKRRTLTASSTAPR